MPHDHQVLSSDEVHAGRVIRLQTDRVTMPGGTAGERDVVRHPGGVGVLALDDRGRVLLVQQYRHPVARRLDELPAGLLDSPDEPALAAARRELAEEAGLAARTWHVLVDLLPDPAMTDEAIRVFLARDLSDVARDVQEHEEVELTTQWQPLSAVVRRVLAGEVESAMTALAVLAADRAVRLDGEGLRPVDAPWPSRSTARPRH